MGTPTTPLLRASLLAMIHPTLVGFLVDGVIRIIVLNSHLPIAEGLLALIGEYLTVILKILMCLDQLSVR